MKHKTEALATFALMYILREYEVDQEVEDKVDSLFKEIKAILVNNDTSIEEVVQEAIKVLERFISKNKVQSTA
ncbi:MAG: hypothetical protein LC100_15255 [Chitinophagales bacterium]|nr:hypothetical protein [Chitinophagales bacterium]